MEKARVVDLIDLQSLVPSLKVTQFNAVGQTNFVIRGFGNGSGNDGIESSVGVIVDGVYRSRTSSALDDLPEVQRIEVLRGPQSTLFGKNVSAGAISIVTARPQFVLGGTASEGENFCSERSSG
ncbi:TonB-dependent receptor plug domain-containing protein [Roseateles sp. GG27B]